MQIIVNRLQRAGLIEMAPNPAHKRSGLFKLTGSGETVANRASHWASGLLDYLGPKFSESELATAAKVLERLGDGLQEYGTELRRVQEATNRPGTADATAPTPAPTPEPSTDAMPVNLL
jgi:DNA-binding MarR family transcriptional regulator